MVSVTDLIHDAVLDTSFTWLCRQRKHWPTSADVWRFRQRWPHEKTLLRQELLTGAYKVGLLSRVTLKNGEDVDLWSARDAVVMKALAIVLGRSLPISPHCTHRKGHGGLKGAIRQVVAEIPRARFVLKTDARSYYASIDHQLLLDTLASHIPDRWVLNLVGQYLRRVTERGGLYWDSQKGIPLGCPLSPIIGAFFLSELDTRLEKLGLFFVRYMDDILVLAPSRWKLRKALKVVNQVLASLELQKHPEKTCIGWVEKGFEFLGYHFQPGRLSVAKKTSDSSDA